MFFASNADAMIAPSPLGNDDRRPWRTCGIDMAAMAPSSVPDDATTNDANSDPHRRKAPPRMLVPSRRRGVARVRDVVWRKELAGDPPGGSSVVSAHDDDDESLGIQSTLERAKDSAMAVTGAPRSLPIIVVLPRSWAREAANDSTATLPHASDGDMMEEEEMEEDATPEREGGASPRRRRTSDRRDMDASSFGGRGSGRDDDRSRASARYRCAALGSPSTMKQQPGRGWRGCVCCRRRRRSTWARDDLSSRVAESSSRRR